MRSVSNRVVLGVDAALLAAFLLLLAPRLTTLPPHEWLGLAVGVPLLVHLLLSWSWISASTRRLRATRSNRARVNYGINATLFVLTVVMIASGAIISQSALPSLGIATANDRWWRAVHDKSVNALLLALGLHVAMNWRGIVGLLRRAMTLPRAAAVGSPVDGSGMFAAARRALAVLLVATLVVAAAWIAVGPPTPARRYPQRESARYAGSPLRGVAELVGEAALLAVVAYGGRRWLRIRL
jgi:cytochrome b